MNNPWIVTAYCSSDTLTISPQPVETGWEVVTPYVSLAETKPRSIPMFYDNDCTGTINIEATQRNHLLDRVHTASWKKRQEGKEQFHIRDDDPPETPTEMIDRIKEGKFRIKKGRVDEDGQEYFPYGPLNYIVWRSEDKDQAGYDAFIEKMMKDQTDAEDIIVLKSLDEGLEALKRFENTTIH